MTIENEAQRKEDMLMGLYKFHAYIPNDAIGSPLTPFGNFVEGYNAAKADSEREIVTLAKDNADLLIERDVALRTVDELQAHINKLREGFEAIIKMNASMIPLPVPNMQVSANHLPYLYDFQLKAKEALAATAAQSLKAHDDELIERCAKECEYAATPYRDADKFYICAEAVRALKGE